MIEWITLIVFTLTLVALVKYTHETTKLRQIEEKRRAVEHDQLIRQYDLNLEWWYHEDQQGNKLVLFLENVGGPVRDVEIIPSKNVSLLDHQRTEWWYPTIGHISFELNPPTKKLTHFSFTAIYTTSLDQRRTKSFMVYVDRTPREKRFIHEIETVNGELRDHLERIGEQLPVFLHKILPPPNDRVSD